MSGAICYGNRWQQNVTAGSGPAPQLNFNVANNEIANSGYVYDAAGDMTNDGTNSYTYDAEGNVIAVDNGSTASYVYDALNRRVRVQTASATDEYNYDYAGRRISTWLPGGAGTEGRIYWGNRQYAFRALNAQTYFDEQNWLGTERERTNYTGGSVNYYQSLPYGDGYLAQYPAPTATRTTVTSPAWSATRRAIPTMLSSGNTVPCRAAGCLPTPTPAATTSAIRRASTATATS